MKYILIFLTALALGLYLHSCHSHKREVRQVLAVNDSIRAQVDSLEIIIQSISEATEQVTQEIIELNDDRRAKEEKVIEILPTLSPPVISVVRDYMWSTDEVIAMYERRDSMRVRKIQMLKRQVELLEEQNDSLRAFIVRPPVAPKTNHILVGIGIGVIATLLLVK